MLIAPHHVALHFEELHVLDERFAGNGARWTWIAGRRFRGVRWL
jgi:hypothetical protein